MADALEPRLLQAQSDKLAAADFLGFLVNDELTRRQDRLLGRRHKEAQFRDADKALDNFDFDFNKKMDRRTVFELATGRFIERHEDAMFLGPPGTGKSHLAQAIGRAAIGQGYRVAYREAHVLLEQLADATLDDMRKEFFAKMESVPLVVSHEISPAISKGDSPWRQADFPRSLVR